MGKKSRIILNRNPRKQHVISQMHLQHFSDQDGNLYVYEKGKEIRKSIPLRESVQRDYFECKQPGYETNFAAERKLSKLEGDASVSYERLLSGETLTTEQGAIWAIYVASLFLRSKKVRLELSSQSFSLISRGQLDTAELREDQWQIFRRSGQLVELGELKRVKSKVINSFSDPVLQQLVAMNYSTPNLAQALGAKRWQVVRPKAGLAFVTSDAPVISFRFLEGGRSSMGVGWGREDTHIAMPLDPHHLFIASPTNVQWASPVDESNTAGFIGTMAQFSYKNVYAQKADITIQELVQQHAGTLIFGRDAYVATNV